MEEQGKGLSLTVKVGIALMVPIVNSVIGLAIVIPALGSLLMYLVLNKFLPYSKKRLAPVLAIHAYFLVTTYAEALQTGDLFSIALVTLELVVGMVWLYWRTNYWSIGYLLIQRLIDLYTGAMFAFTVHEMGSVTQKKEFAVFVLMLTVVCLLINLALKVRVEPRQ
jgi:hypothetical protein